MVDEALLRAYLDTFPDKWVSNFETTKMYDMADTTCSRITSHMMEKESASAVAQTHNEARQKSGTVKKTGSPNTSKRTVAKGHCTFSKKKDNNKGGYTGPPKNDEQCHLHPYSDHTWIKCNQHPKNVGKKPTSNNKKKVTHKETEDAHVHSESEDADETRTKNNGSPIDLVGSGKPTVCFTTLTFNDESHHLDCFAMNVIDAQQPLTQTSSMYRTITSGMPCSSSLKRTRQQLNSFGQQDTLASAAKEWSETEVTNKVIDELFSDNSPSESYVSGSSSNEIKTKLDVTPTTVLVAKTTQGVYFKQPMRVLLDLLIAK